MKHWQRTTGMSLLLATTTILPLYGMQSTVTTTLASKASGASGTSGSSASGTEGGFVVSPTGRYVVFSSESSDLDPANDASCYLDVFLHDTVTDTTILVSAISGSSANTATTLESGSGNGELRDVSVDESGNLVVFVSDDSNLDPLVVDSNFFSDIYIRDLTTLSTRGVSFAGTPLQPGPGTSQHPCISRDGAYIAYAGPGAIWNSAASGPSIVLRDVGLTKGCVVDVDQTGNPVSTGGESAMPSLSANGSVVAFASTKALAMADTDNLLDIYVRDTVSQQTEWITSDPALPSGMCTLPTISDDGNRIAFLCNESGSALAQVYVYDRTTTQTVLASQKAGIPSDVECKFPWIAPKGRFVAFTSGGSNLGSGGVYFLYDIESDTIVECGLPGSGADGIVPSEDANRLAFVSDDESFSPNDSNGFQDVFLRDTVGCPLIYCTSQTSSSQCTAAIGHDGGSPSASPGMPWNVTATGVMGAASGLLFYSTAGPNNFPFNGGTLCILPPTTRLCYQSARGGTGTCFGTFSENFNDVIQNKPALFPGVFVWAQYWSRDIGNPQGGSNLSDAVTFVITN